MFRTRNDRRLEARAALGDQLALTITSSEDFEIDWGDGTTDTVSSGFRQSHTYAREYHGPVIIRPVDKTAVNVTFTEWTLEGNFDWVDVGAFPVEATSIVVKDAYRLKHEAEWAPTNLSNVYMASTRGMLPGDVDRLIQALEERTQNNGTLLVQGTPRKSKPQLETLQGAVRNWAAEVVPAVCLQVTAALAPFTRIVDGIARWVRGQRNGTPRQLEPGRCASFNDLDDEVPCGTNTLGDQDQTITAWVRSSSAGNGGYILATRSSAGDGGISMMLGSNNQFTVLFGGSGVQNFSGTIPLDKWVHLAIVYRKDSELAEGFVNGKSVGTRLNTHDQPNWTLVSGEPVYIGNRHGGSGSHYFGGELFDIRQFDYALSDENIAEIAAMDWTKTEDQIGPRDPLIWYKLDEESTDVRNSGSLGGAGDGVVTTSNIANFRNKSGVNNVFSYQNNVGFNKQNLVEGTRVFSGDTDFDDKYGFRSTGHIYTLEGWFKSTKTNSSYIYDVTSPRRVFAWVKFAETNRLAFYQGAGWVDFGADSTPSDGEEHHIAFVINGTEASCYVDGVQVGTTQTVPGSSLGDWKRGRLGADSSLGTTNEFDGTMRDVTLWDYALSAGEIARRYEGIEPLGKRITINVPRNESNPDFDVDGNPLTYVGQAPIEPIIETACLTTDGVGDYVDTGVTLDGATEFTIFRRAKYLSTTGYDLDGCGTLGAGSILFGRDSGNNKIFLSAGDDGSSVVLDDTIADDVVHSLAVTTKVGGNRSIYLDGEAISTATAASDTFTSPISNTSNFMIGARNKSGASHWVHAEYYEYYIYERQLSDDEILYLHTFGQQGVDPSNDGLVLCYSFGDGKSPIRDRSGNTNDGFLNSANHAAAWAGRQSLYNPFAEGFVDLFGTTWPKLIGSDLDSLLGIDCTGAAGQLARYQAWDFDCNEPNSPFALNCSQGRTFVKYEFTGDSGDRRMFASGAVAGPFTPEVPTVVEIYEDTLSVELASEVAKVY